MDKEQFYFQLHGRLAIKYGLTIRQIQTIRSFVGKEQTRKDIATWCAMKLAQPAHKSTGSKVGRRTAGLEHYQQILNFTASCKEEQWTDINQYANWANEAGTEPQPSKSD